jgi:hypothetical protein
MIPRWSYLLCLATALEPSPASAQPLFHAERNWTITIGERLYGLRQVVQTPGERRWTQVWMGRSVFDVRCRAEEILALPLLPPVHSIAKIGYWVEWRSFRTLP